MMATFQSTTCRNDQVHGDRRRPGTSLKEERHLRRSVVGLTLSTFILSAFAVNLIVSLFFPGMQVFAVSGLSKKVLLPALYCAATGIILMKQHPLKLPRFPFPIALKIFIPMLFASIIGTLIDARQNMIPLDLAQGLILFFGFVALQRLGTLLAYEPESIHRRILLVLSGVGLTCQVAGISSNPLSSLGVPAAVYALVITWKERRQHNLFHIMTVTILAMGSLVLYFTRASPGHPLSLAVIAQMAACSCIILACFSPPILRTTLFLAVSLAGLWAVHKSHVWQIFFGNYAFEDITVSHRGYETAAVLELMNNGAVSQIFGLGPSGTVDLSVSPDARTLVHSGRNLGAVDDVHLITSYLLLKFGILGLLWLGLFLVAYLRIAFAVFNRRLNADTHPQIGYLLFLTAGIVNSVTAATNLFTNPLVGLFIGALGASIWQRKQGVVSARPRPSRNDHAGELEYRHFTRAGHASPVSTLT